MPYTMPHTPTAHIWPEVEDGETATLEPLCGEADPTGDVRFDLVRLEERDMSAGRPRTVPEWVLWREVCRECAEVLADRTKLRTAPVQWAEGVGSKRAGKLKPAGYKTLADLLAEGYQLPPETWDTAADLVATTGAIEEATGIAGGHVKTMLTSVITEGWRRHTEPRGEEWLRSVWDEARGEH